MGTAFSKELNGDGFFEWVEWERLFHVKWAGRLLIWVGWERLFHMG
jgi:hypothetical protein